MQKSRLPSFRETRQKSVEVKATKCIPDNRTQDHLSNISSFCPGEKVVVGGAKYGTVRYFGATHFAVGEWCGIELDEPDGKHNGEVDGKKYFDCKDRHGIFAPKHKVVRLKLNKEPVKVNVSNSHSAPMKANIPFSQVTNSTTDKNVNLNNSKNTFKGNLKKNNVLSKSSLCLGNNAKVEDSSGSKKSAKTLIARLFPQTKNLNSKAEDIKNVKAEESTVPKTAVQHNELSKTSNTQLSQNLSSSRFRLDDIFYEDDRDENLEHNIALLLAKTKSPLYSSLMQLNTPIPDLLMPSECHVRPTQSNSSKENSAQINSSDFLGLSANSKSSFAEVLNDIELDNNELLEAAKTESNQENHYKFLQTDVANYDTKDDLNFVSLSNKNCQNIDNCNMQLLSPSTEIHMQNSLPDTHIQTLQNKDVFLQKSDYFNDAGIVTDFLESEICRNNVTACKRSASVLSELSSVDSGLSPDCDVFQKTVGPTESSELIRDVLKTSRIFDTNATSITDITSENVDVMDVESMNTIDEICELTLETEEISNRHNERRMTLATVAEGDNNEMQLEELQIDKQVANSENTGSFNKSRRPSAIAKFKLHSLGNNSNSSPSHDVALKSNNPVRTTVMRTERKQSLPNAAIPTLLSNGVSKQHRVATSPKSGIQQLDRKKLCGPSTRQSVQKSTLPEKNSASEDSIKEKRRKSLTCTSALPRTQRRRSDASETSSQLPRYMLNTCHAVDLQHNVKHDDTTETASSLQSSVADVSRCRSPALGSDSQLSGSELSVKCGSRSSIPKLSLKRKSHTDITDPILAVHDFCHTSSPEHERKIRNIMLHEIARKSELSMRNDGVKTIRSRIFGSHPDVVYHDIANDEGHLQMVCDHRLKLLKASRRDLQQAQRSVEALLIVIKHISEKVENTQTKLNFSNATLRDLRSQYEQAMMELAQMKDMKRDEMKLLWDAEKNMELSQLKEIHELEIRSQAEVHEARIAEIESMFSGRLKLEQDERLKVAEHVQQECSIKIEGMLRQHQAEVKDMASRFECIKSSLVENVNSLQSQLQEYKQREQVFMENLRQNSNDEVQAAIASFKQLPLELDSMRVVLDMRTQDNHALRGKIIDLEKQVEEMHSLRDIIKAQQQKIENLQAVIELRSDYERQLSEKHRVLLRKHEQESKALKRLSMNNEQLAWRLSFGDNGGVTEPDGQMPWATQRGSLRSVLRQHSDQNYSQSMDGSA